MFGLSRSFWGEGLRKIENSRDGLGIEIKINKTAKVWRKN